VNVFAASVLAIVADVLGNVITVESAPAKVSEFEAANVLPSATVSVEPVAGAVRVTLLTVVAVATPSVGVTSVGDIARTTEPVPVLAVAATPLMEKLLPVPAVSYVLLVNVSVAEAVE